VSGFEIHHGDPREIACDLDKDSIDCIVTSPPYFAQRRYGVVSCFEDGWSGELGQENDSGDYIVHLLECLMPLKRLLKPTGTFWLNLGDARSKGRQWLGIPHRVVLALQERGWLWVDEIVWSKPDAMPFSGTVRCCRSHEYIFMLAQEKNYYYDYESILEPLAQPEHIGSPYGGKKYPGQAGIDGTYSGRTYDASKLKGKRKRSVWSCSTSKERRWSHFAPYPGQLIMPCILAGCPEGGTVLDPFSGSGTTGERSLLLGRNYVGIDLSIGSVEQSRVRLAEIRSRMGSLFS